MTVRATGTILALALVGGLAVSWAVSTFVTDRVQYVADVGFLWTGVTAMLAAIAGVLLFGAEVQHGTLASTLAARPARWVIVLAKALVAAVLGLVLGAAGLAAGFGGAVLAGLDAGDTSSVAGTIGWALLFTTLSAVLGLGIAMVVRNSTAAIGGLLVWGFVVENLFRLFLADEIARFLPFVAGNHLLTDSAGFDSPAALAVALTRPENALVFGGVHASSPSSSGRSCCTDGTRTDGGRRNWHSGTVFAQLSHSTEEPLAGDRRQSRRVDRR